MDIKFLSKIFTIFLGGTLFFPPTSLYAGQAGNFSTLKPLPTRGEIIASVVNSFDLAQRKQSFIQSCKAHPDECFFVFMAMSRFDGIEFAPLTLYPDVSPAYIYYEDINVATMLGIIHGYLDEKGSPLYPRRAMKRIDALKVILTAADLITWKDRFELVQELGSEAALKQQKTVFKDTAVGPDSWWYPRYLNVALEADIIDAAQYFRPEDFMSLEEFENMLERAHPPSFCLARNSHASVRF